MQNSAILKNKEFNIFNSFDIFDYFKGYFTAFGLSKFSPYYRQCLKRKYLFELPTNSVFRVSFHLFMFRWNYRLFLIFLGYKQTMIILPGSEGKIIEAV